MTTQGKVRGLSAVLAAIWIIACGSNGSSGTAGSGGTGGKPTDGGEGGAGGEGATNGTGGQKPVSCTGNTDPDCECVDGSLRGKDADGDGEFSRACAKAPGKDCNDGDDSVTSNECGGCSDLGAKKGDDCLECGVYKCDGEESLACKAPNATTRRCDSATSRQLCVDGVWEADPDTCSGATPACLEAECVACTPSKFRCDSFSYSVSYSTSTSSGYNTYYYWDIYQCGSDGAWGTTKEPGTCDQINGKTCNTNSGCVTGAYDPRDRVFELPGVLRGDDSFDGRAFEGLLNRATGFELG